MAAKELFDVVMLNEKKTGTLLTSWQFNPLEINKMVTKPILEKQISNTI